MASLYSVGQPAAGLSIAYVCIWRRRRAAEVQCAARSWRGSDAATHSPGSCWAPWLRGCRGCRLPGAASRRRDRLLRPAGSFRERRHAATTMAVSAGDRLTTGFDPDAQGLLPRRRPQGPDARGSTTSRVWAPRRSGWGPSTRTSRCRAGRARRAPGTTATGSPTSPASIRISAPTRDMHAFVERRARARHEGVPRHHHQPHRRRDPVSRVPEHGLPVPLARGLSVHAQGRPRRRSRSTRDSPGDGVRTAANFARLTDPGYAYTPFVPPAEANVKVPDLAEFAYLLPQPRQFGFLGRELAARRFLRPR